MHARFTGPPQKIAEVFFRHGGLSLSAKTPRRLHPFARRFSRAPEQCDEFLAESESTFGGRPRFGDAGAHPRAVLEFPVDDGDESKEVFPHGLSNEDGAIAIGSFRGTFRGKIAHLCSSDECVISADGGVVC